MTEVIDDRYRILARLGQGSAGTVYKVRDEEEGVVKALKTFNNAELSGRELAPLQHLNHPSIVRPLETGDNYFTMDFVEGIPLDQLKLPLTDWRPLALDILRALKAIHEAGWLHGDLKPGHVYCPAAGGVKLLDFGLAQRNGDNWAPAGTPGYIAPEVLRGQPPDIRSDLYSFGCLLYLLATGTAPFVGRSSLELMLKQIGGEPRAASDLNRKLSREDNDLIHLLLAKDPANRPASAAEVIALLDGGAATDTLPPRDLREPPLVGRETASDRLGRILQAAGTGRGRFILLHGEEGVGRSRFLDSVRSEATLIGLKGANCRFKPWVSPPYNQLLHSLERCLETDPFDQATGPSQLAAECRRGVDDTPRILLLDDVQEADASTLKAIDALASLCDELPLVIVAAWRDGLVHGSAIRHMPSACSGRNYYDITLPRFEKSETFNFIAGTLGQNDATSQNLTHVLHEPCQGKPRQLRDSLRALRDQHHLQFLNGSWTYDGEVQGGSVDTDHWLTTRVDKLGKGLQEVLQTVALAGGPSPVELIQDVTGGDEKKLLAQLHDLVRNGFLRREGWGWIPVNEALTQYVTDKLSDRQKIKAHRKIARIVERVHDPLQRALMSWSHLVYAGEINEGLERLEQAAGLLQRDRQEDTALDLCRRGLQIAGDDHVEVRARLLARLGNSARRNGDWTSAVDTLGQALSLDSTLKKSARLHTALAQALVETGMTDQARHHLDQAARLDKKKDVHLMRRLLEARCLAGEGDLDGARARLEACLEESRARDEPNRIAEAHVELGRLERDDGDYAASERHLVAARKLRKGDRPAIAAIDLERVETAIDDGRLEAAGQMLGALRDRDLDRSILRGRRDRLRCLWHLHRGDFGEARVAYSRCLRQVPAWQVSEERHALLGALLDHLPIVQAAQVDWLQGEIRQHEDPKVVNAWKEKLARLEFSSGSRDNPVQILSEIASLLNSERSLTRLFPLIMDQVIQVVGAERGFLMLREGDGDDLHFAAARNLDQKTIAQPAFAISASLAREVMSHGEAILTRDALNDERFSQSDSIQELKLRSILCVPLKTRDKLIGVVYVDNRSLSDKFNIANLNLLSAVADQAALAIENARLNERNLQQNKQLEKTARRLAERGRRLEATVSRQNQELASIRRLRDPLQDLQGDCPAVENLRSLIRRAAAGTLPVLVIGESGTGKGLVAQALHQLGEATGPFEAVNCGAFNRDLLESELFGHVRGAFTGAVRDHVGVFERADGGTLFLDEIGDMPPEMQVKLLRVLETGEVRPVGATQPVSVSVRIIAATHRNLEADIHDGVFRSDLFYRLSGLALTLPPLRDRGQDLEILFTHFLAEAADENDRPTPEVDATTLSALHRWRWPGNIRELRNLAQRLVALGRDRVVEEDLPRKVTTNADSPLDFNLEDYKSGRKDLLDAYDVAIVRSSLQRATGNVSAAARTIGIERQYFHKIMKKHSIQSDEFRG